MLDNDQLLLALKRDEAGAFEQLYAAYHDVLYYRALSIVKDEFVAKDIVQDCFINFYEKKLYHRVTVSLQALLFIRIKSLCIDYLRAEKAAQNRMSNYQYAAAQQESTDPINEYLEQKNRLGRLNELQHDFTDFLSKLPHQQRQVLKVIFKDGKSYAEGAADTGMKLNTFRTHLERVYKKLKTRFQQTDYYNFPASNE